MTSSVVVPFPARPAEPTLDELAAQISVLAGLVIELARDGDIMRAQLAEFESRLPPPTFEPKGWLAAKRAAHDLGVSKSSIYRMCKDGRLESFKPKGYGIRINPVGVGKLKRDFLKARAHPGGRTDSE